MVLNTARPKYKESTTLLGMRGRDAVRKWTLKVNILQVFTIDSSEIPKSIVNHNSQSDGQNQSAKRWTNLQKKILRIISLQRNLEDTKDNGISHLEQVRQKWAYETSIRFSTCWSLSKIDSTASQANQLKCLSIQINTVDGIPLQAHRGGTSLNGTGNELIKFLIDETFFVTVGFVYSRLRSIVTDGVCRQIHLTRHFSHALLTS